MVVCSSVPFAAESLCLIKKVSRFYSMKNYPADILEDLASYLTYHRNLGIDNYPMSGELQGFLAKELPRRENRGIVTPPQVIKERRTVVEPAPEAPGMRASEGPPEVLTLATVTKDFKQCNACSLAGESIQGSIGKGGDRPRLLIVGHWLETEKGERVSPTTVFGIRQDLMIERMIGAIRLTPEKVYVTNLVKCVVQPGVQPKAGDVRKCFEHLQRQVAALKPQIILTMGMVPSRLFLGRSDSLSRLRGKLHSYSCLDGTEIPLVATYHPTFLLENEGMKSATWLDLQLVAKQLGIEIK